MQPTERIVAQIGIEPPLVIGRRSTSIDRREVSARWLCGTVLTGITSSLLMGTALFTALESREQVVRTPELLDSERAGMKFDGPALKKTNRLMPTRALTNLSEGRRIDVSTMTKSGDVDVVAMRPFVQMKMSLVTGHAAGSTYPPFDPLTIFTEEDPVQDTSFDSAIYGTNVDGVVRLRTVDFPLEAADFEATSALSSEEVEIVVRELSEFVTIGNVEVASLSYVNPNRFGAGGPTASLDASANVRIVQQNVSIARRNIEDTRYAEYTEDVLTVRSEREIAKTFEEGGYVGASSDGIVEALVATLGTETLQPGDIVRLGIDRRGLARHVVRASIYRARAHVATIALNDKLKYVQGDEPEPISAVSEAIQSRSRHLAKAPVDAPTIYDGIYRASLSHGLTEPMTRQLVRLLSTNVDLQAPIGPEDQIEMFYSQPDENNRATSNSRLLYVEARIDGATRRFYRFQLTDDTVDYFDEGGRTTRSFLLRNPIPTGRFTSGFGNRRHPILGYVRPHTGVDWAAPRGTPIIAPGDGTVDRAGWNGGYGRQTAIRYGDGYLTTFNHQSKIADGVIPGARVRQGQIIGYVGSTGQSTGNHLHYELLINGKKVDPMRVRLPSRQGLSGAALTAFLAEKKRIDNLLEDDRWFTASTTIHDKNI
ncbi:M23 family metallopeptidase (plasmid) [Nitratireductor rhodophyticola]|uniref:M23 family metallopeptidase n=1 Tax=Nitratireductor rhodophyticola TaxID=2854036 RepID=A0ABS7RF40_9HYPH|nr:M23 family metallopeptidase [Nitratireductor rhodophyticola]MAS13085.1 peptidase M24 [Nitratireductor sp.]MBY8919027.1 M23 family metallopeptidase [Nitratireductor rhodophyticola]MCB1469002.1 M23 family metallopeptidase [Rhizobiaceae bacterium]MEC9243324.1 M23 family metallopeptidase [Pseudomonadota bacterium]MBY8923122.1 M23 family metallopeptidase [Nitratireductor rhodophyticola]